MGRNSPEPIERDDVHVAAIRCPFCHEDISGDGLKHGCPKCMAWHHQACWQESDGCSACGQSRLLSEASPVASVVSTPQCCWGGGDCVEKGTEKWWASPSKLLCPEHRVRLLRLQGWTFLALALFLLAAGGVLLYATNIGLIAEVGVWVVGGAVLTLLCILSFFSFVSASEP